VIARFLASHSCRKSSVLVDDISVHIENIGVGGEELSLSKESARGERKSEKAHH
jgi:hypothetical protein